MASSLCGSLPRVTGLKLFSAFPPPRNNLRSSCSASDHARSLLYDGGGSVTCRQISLDGTLSRQKIFSSSGCRDCQERRRPQWFLEMLQQMDPPATRISDSRSTTKDLADGRHTWQIRPTRQPERFQTQLGWHRSAPR
jgi:hypothetical protein